MRHGLVQEAVTCVIECSKDQLAVSTMSCHYYLGQLVNPSGFEILLKIKGSGSAALSLLKMPNFDKDPKLCGIESRNIVCIDLKRGSIEVLQSKQFESKSPWCNGAFYMKGNTSSLVVIDEKTKTLRHFIVDI